MYVFSILVAIALTVCMGDDDINPRIVGGEDAVRGEFPWHVKLTYASRKINYFCGGSILDENNILTAAHCIMDINQRKGVYQILAGVHKAVGKEPLQQPRFVKSVAVHPRYYIKPLTLLNDVAVMHLETPLVFTNTVQPVNLTDAAFDKVAMRSDRCLVHGLGVTYEKMNGDGPQDLPTLDSTFPLYFHK